MFDLQKYKQTALEKYETQLAKPRHHPGVPITFKSSWHDAAACFLLNLHIFHDFFFYHYYYSKYLELKTGLLRQARRPGDTLIQAVKQSYGICCLTGHVFKRVQWLNVNNMKMMSRNISNPLSLAYSIFCVVSWPGSKHSRISKNFSSPH